MRLDLSLPLGSQCHLHAYTSSATAIISLCPSVDLQLQSILHICLQCFPKTVLGTPRWTSFLSSSGLWSRLPLLTSPLTRLPAAHWVLRFSLAFAQAGTFDSLVITSSRNSQSTFQNSARWALQCEPHTHQQAETALCSLGLKCVYIPPDCELHRGRGSVLTD